MATNENPTMTPDDDVHTELHSIRQSIDNIDAALVHLLAERFKFTQKVGRLKAEHGLPPADPDREREQIQRLRALAEESHLDPGFAEKFLNFIIAEVIHHHETIANDARGHPLTWDPTALPDQTGKTIVVTGANAGIGYFISEQLAAAGADVVLACRDERRGDAALTALRGRVPGARAELLPLDVSSLASVRSAAVALLSRERVDVVIENAGITSPPAKRTINADGNELVLATNVIGHFALTALIMPVLERTPRSRVVTMGSQATRLINFRADDLQLERGYSSWRSYAQSKIAVEAFGFELDRRLRAAGSGMSSLVAHPGYAVSGRSPRIRGVNDPGRGARFVDELQGIFGAQGKSHGAWSAVRAAVDPDAVSGQYWGPRARVRGLPSLQSPASVCRDPATGARVWADLERYASQPFPLG